MTRKPWYAQGLRFECQRCGACCQRKGGSVWLMAEDLDRLAAACHLSLEAFGFQYCVAGAGRRLQSIDGGCVLLEPDGLCGLYRARPLQCRTWPWWAGVIASRGAWQAATSSCPGMNCGHRWRAHEIEEQVAASRATGIALGA